MVPAGLAAVTGGLAVTRGLGLLSFFRFFTMTFFFLMTRIRTCCCEVPGDQGGQHRGREEGPEFQVERSAIPRRPARHSRFPHEYLRG